MNQATVVSLPAFRFVKVENDFVTDRVMSDVELSETEGWKNVTDVFPLPEIGWKYYAEFNQFRPYTEQHILLENTRIDARRAIDFAAGEARGRHYTVINGQEEVYREKFDEAIDYITRYDDSTSIDDDYPFLLVETAIRGMTMIDVAHQVIRARKDWIRKMAAIEALRVGGKFNIQDCVTVTEINRLKGHYVHKLNLT